MHCHLSNIENTIRVFIGICLFAHAIFNFIMQRTTNVHLGPTFPVPESDEREWCMINSCSTRRVCVVFVPRARVESVAMLNGIWLVAPKIDLKTVIIFWQKTNIHITFHTHKRIGRVSVCTFNKPHTLSNTTYIYAMLHVCYMLYTLACFIGRED